MSALHKPSPETSADATNHILHDLAVNKRLNGSHNAIQDAYGFARGCVAFIQANDGHVAVRRFLHDLIIECNGRITLESIIKGGRP